MSELAGKLHAAISNEDYHAGPGISKSGLDLIARSPAHYLHEKEHPTPPTPAMQLGTAFHALVLEGERFDAEYACGLNAGRRSKVDKELWADYEKEHAGKTILKFDDYARLLDMHEAILEHPYASILLDGDSGPVEQSAYWIDEDTGAFCKCRPDKINDVHNFVVDLKSTDDASYTGFATAVSRYRYHVQAAFYSDGCAAVGVPVKRFYFVAVEKSPPYGIGIYQLDKEEIEFGVTSYQRDLALYWHCTKHGDWPGYDPEPRVLQIPRWGLRSRVS